MLKKSRMVVVPQIGRKLTYKRQARRFLQRAVEQAVQDQVSTPARRLFRETATPEEWHQAFLEWTQSHHDLPLLPASAFSREADYEDCD